MRSIRKRLIAGWLKRHSKTLSFILYCIFLVAGIALIADPSVKYLGAFLLGIAAVFAILMRHDLT